MEQTSQGGNYVDENLKTEIKCSVTIVHTKFTHKYSLLLGQQQILITPKE
jgi:hypothetical protein